ncbi:quinate pathway repressor protein [Colletotrichum karsti]|uniref:Quinate pathway repressor protein n=1 Tax=Colletotrichum karsti TaxID=1095194 RepID=A0A9P6I6U6_9PEZI|nr:quinate pathway repressor protein [Colletotrichum karsti]KAF9875061.1 quinate pathway repressor protein [Colletotrichum karsti]
MPARPAPINTSDPAESSLDTTTIESMSSTPWQGFMPRVQTYHRDASIALVGIRGTGRSTLAVMASSALGFRLLDADQHFFQVTGLSRSAYKTQNGAAEYRREELKLMRSMLFENPTRAVIACGPGAVEGTGQAWLSEYAQTHPVIYILRDADEIKRHLRVWDADAIKRLIHLSGPTHRSVSNFEFYNISDSYGQTAEQTSMSGQQSPRSLALKRVEHDFLDLIFTITDRDRQGQSFYPPGHSDASLMPEFRPFTYSLTLPILSVDAAGPRLGGINTTADVAELVISLQEMRTRSLNFDDPLANFISRQYYAVKRYTRLPIILNFQLDDASSNPDITYYLRLVNHGLRLAPEYLCVDLSCEEAVLRDIMSSKGTSKVMGHFTDVSVSEGGWDNPALKQKIHLAERLGCDIVRVCRIATSTTDNFAAKCFAQGKPGEFKIPVIAYNTGRLGRMSCYLNQTFTPVTDPLLRSITPSSTTEVLLTIQEAQKALYSSFLLDPMYFGIYGTNVLQSLSPAMHNAAFASCGMPHEYKTFQHPTVNDLRHLIADENFGGASITAPFKKEVFALVDFTSPEAQAIGAVNTLIPLRSATIHSLLDRNRSGPVAALYGDNTDWIGIHTCIRQNLSPINGVKRRTTALVLGAGGMARAAVYALLRLGVRSIFIYNRTSHNAQEMIRHFEGYHSKSRRGSPSQPGSGESLVGSPDMDVPSLKALQSKTDRWPEDVDRPTIVVSCISTPEENGQSSVDRTLPSEWLSSPTGGVAIELSYMPLESPFLKQVKEMINVDETVEDVIKKDDFGGASVTFPHKLQIGKLLDRVSPFADKIGAVNTVIVEDDPASGKRLLVGDNTDWHGIKRCIEKSGIEDLRSSAALILGAGGAARAACFAVQEIGISEVIVVNRTASKARDMAAKFPRISTVHVFESLEAAVLRVQEGATKLPVRVVIACVPADDLTAEKVPAALFSGAKSGVLVEMAYRPQVTGMMFVASLHDGWRVFKGVDVLEEQAYAQFELWTGRKAPVEVMRAAMQAKIKENERAKSSM